MLGNMCQNLEVACVFMAVTESALTLDAPFRGSELKTHATSMLGARGHACDGP